MYRFYCCCFFLDIPNRNWQINCIVVPQQQFVQGATMSQSGSSPAAPLQCPSPTQSDLQSSGWSCQCRDGRSLWARHCTQGGEHSRSGGGKNKKKKRKKQQKKKNRETHKVTACQLLTSPTRWQNFSICRQAPCCLRSNDKRKGKGECFGEDKRRKWKYERNRNVETGPKYWNLQSA